ncbi:pentapeptide repeat-containing protein [Leptolyngbyaceae cyanobacterium CCMR0082]|uniref:Pentapeptide repeat-containing protein n=1 Tax=Adonisia turfae CCMR0082 TaxID=2304604 RepID=A0A6M0SID9_9CYAN|nr:pentapeptide repeat-containing protein [Adonisia turfae]NEZ68348.1 pentapeptide repeat-containing protein [Adonisia turfae CCMR0082]
MAYNHSGRRNLKNQHFEGQDLRNKEDFRDADLTNASFKGANLQKVDFSGAIIQGTNFRGADLREAIFTSASVDHKNSYPTVDFHNADIRGADFTDAILSNANFSEAKTGLNRLWRFFVIAVSIFLCLLSAFPTAIVTTLSLNFFRKSRKKISLVTSLLIGVWAVILTVALRTFFVTVSAGWLVKAHVSVGTAMILLVLFGTIIALISTESDDDFSGVAIATIGALSFLMLTVYSDALSSVEKVALGSVFKLLGLQYDGTLASGIFGAGLGAIYGCWFARSAISEGQRFNWLWKIYVRFVVNGGTLFKRANLTQAIFAAADLRGANFKDAKIMRTSWQRAISLEYARVGNSYLKYSGIRNLVLGRTIRNKNFDGLDLEGINLEEADLTGVSFSGTNLSQANLRGAILEEANLQQAKLNGADLTNVKLNAACVLNWTVDKNTLLDDVDCKYVFLEKSTNMYGGRRQFPPPPKEFEPGDFKKVFQTGQGQFQVLVRQDDNKKALLNTINHLQQDKMYRFRGFDMLGKDALIKFDIPESIDASVAQDDFQSTYQVEVEQEKENDPLKGYSIKDIVLMVADVAGDRIVNFNGDKGSYVERVEGNYAHRDYIEFNQDLTQAAAQIQQLLTQLRKPGQSEEDIQKQVADEISQQAKSNPSMKEKLTKWGESLAGSAVSNVVEGVIKLACNSVGIPL